MKRVTLHIVISDGSGYIKEVFGDKEVTKHFSLGDEIVTSNFRIYMGDIKNPENNSSGSVFNKIMELLRWDSL